MILTTILIFTILLIYWLRPTGKPKEVERRYTSDWPQIARAYKQHRKYVCEDCRVSLIRARNLMHVHHIDLDPQNNKVSNLRALCVECHSKMEGVGHRRLAAAIRTDGRLKRLRQIKSRQQPNWLCRLMKWLFGI